MYSSEIRREFHNTVAALIAKGMTIYPDTMNGSQGEIAHVDLTDGSEIYRVVLESKSCFGGIPGFYGRAIVLTVGRAPKSDFYTPIDEELGNYHRTIWNNRLEDTTIRQWFEISDRGRGWYTDEAGARHQGEVRRARYGTQYVNPRQELGTAWKSAALKWVRKQRGFKTCTLSDISEMYRVVWTDSKDKQHRRFEIKARGKKLTIEM